MHVASLLCNIIKTLRDWVRYLFIFKMDALPSRILALFFEDIFTSYSITKAGWCKYLQCFNEAGKNRFEYM